jgi:asparagine synthetase B (glutamine-hydrolysing)
MLANSAISVPLASAIPYFRDFTGVFDLDQGLLVELTLFSQGGSEELPISESDYQVKLVGELLLPTRREGLTDDETVLLEFRRRGLNCFPTINGSFAIIVWDPKERTLSLARDAAGTIPIYYHIHGGRVLFGTSLRILENHPFFRKELDPQGVGEFLFFLYIGSPSCIFKNTYKVPAGSFVSFRNGGIKTTFYPMIEENRKDMSLAEAISIEGPVLTEAVRRCLHPRHQNVICLSGGIDSSTIAAIATKMDAPLVALTAEFEDRQVDESPFAKIIAKYLGIQHQSILIEKTQVIEDLPRIYDVFDEPVATIQFFALTRACGLTGTIFLDGSGADVSHGVPPPVKARHVYLTDRLLPSNIRKFVAFALRSSPIGFLRNIGSLLSYQNFEDLLVQLNGWPRRALPDGCNIQETYYFQLYREWRDRTDLFGLFNRLYSYWGSNEAVPKAAIAARRLGNIIRFPYEDIDFQRTIKGLPRSVKYNRGETKRVPRSILGDYMPASLYERKKHGFRQPILSVLRHRNHQLILEYLDIRAIQNQGILDPTLVGNAVSKFLGGDDREAWRIWAVLLLQIFLKVRMGW